MNYWTLPLLGLSLFIGATVGSFILGRKLGRRFRTTKKGTIEGTGVINAALFALMGLLISFSFSGASSRFDERRKLIIQEAGAIGAAYMRIDLAPESAQPRLREDFRRYLEERIAVYRDIDDVPMAEKRLADAGVLQRIIWNEAVAAVAPLPNPAPAMIFLPAVNEMIGITRLRTAVFTFHPPLLVMLMLAGLALVCSSLAGFEMGGTTEISRLHVIGFVAIIALTIYVCIDMEYPRRGLIRVDATDKFLFDLRTVMK